MVSGVELSQWSMPVNSGASGPTGRPDAIPKPKLPLEPTPRSPRAD